MFTTTLEVRSNIQGKEMLKIVEGNKGKEEVGCITS